MTVLILIVHKTIYKSLKVCLILVGTFSRRSTFFKKTMRPFKPINEIVNDNEAALHVKANENLIAVRNAQGCL